MTFTSNKSMEIEVFVDAEPFVGESQERYRAVSAFVTYVSLNKEGRPQPVPQLVTSTAGAWKRIGSFSLTAGLALGWWILGAIKAGEVETEDERRRFEEGKGRYLQTKAKRQAKMKPLTQQ
uniref:Uncharacterized protein n=1 Tax=Sphaerodactylus townsendi TaxID=933632 RepID=A0ACB8EDS1_9SAUR